MALILREMYQEYKYILDDLSDERALEYPLMQSPIPTFLIMGLYVYFAQYLGPRLMQNRPAYNIKNIMIAFNIVQVVLNSYLVYHGIKSILPMKEYSCLKIDYSRSELGLWQLKLTYIYFWTKLSDLLDTVFFVLRKNNRQITFLHVYHHTGMVLLVWIAVKFLGGGHSLYLGIINSFVHAIMYSYYLLTAWDEKYKKSLWWKKHITQMQLAQFIIFLFIYGQILVGYCDALPKIPMFLLVLQDVCITVLFADFYIKTYVLKPKAKTNKES